MPRRLLVTSALPYANGHIHVGHLVEYLQTDIWVRFQRLRGNACTYVCADDTHGTSIMLRARAEGRSEAEVISEMSAAHQRDFADFGIAFDHYGSTHSDENRALCAQFWRALRAAGLVTERSITQLYDAQVGVFLADRFVKGTCPNCGSKEQYGDACEKCNAVYGPADLKDARSTLSGTVPELREALHLFVRVEKYHEFLAAWVKSGVIQPEIANYLSGHFLAHELRDWDVSRPQPYFGFEIPDAPGHFWYVWFDAPIGYVAATQALCSARGEKLDDYWRSEHTEIHHFIGKDIVYFHTLFWPVMLKVAGFSLPTEVHVHGFLTVDGEKMSKSRGTFILARTYLDHLDPAYLRYYYASKLGPGADDLDLNLEEFVARVNADLVGKVVNLASRTARLARPSGLAASYPEDGGLFAAAAREGEEIARAYDAGDLARAMRLIMALADRANEYIDRVAPWKLAKDPARSEELQQICTVALNLYRQLALYLSPVLPKLAEQSALLLGTSLDRWEAASQPLLGTSIQEFQHLMARVEPAKLAAVIASSKQADEGAPPAPASVEVSLEPLASEISVDELGKVDLRIAKVLRAEAVPEANKLLKLTVSLGALGERTIFAGIKAAYAPSALEGQLVVIVANLAPRKMRFGVSEGMVLAAGSGGEELFLLSPHAGAQPGQRLH